jgi:hypothetical protein
MKKVIYVSLISFLLITSCKKDKVCTSYTELTDDYHLLDISAVNSTPELIDTLTKYSKLQVYRVIDDEYILGVHCNLFNQGLKVFNDGYSLLKSKNNGNIISWDTVPASIEISTIPSIQFEEAINIARQSMDYDKKCISYRLGFYDINANLPNQIKSYKLTWKIQGNNGAPYVMLDANNGQIYSKFDGKYY